MNKSHLSNFKEREKLLPSRWVLNYFGLKAGQRFADLGCGYGFFTLPTAEIIGPSGMVAAVDINPEGLAELKKRALAGNVDQIITTYLSDGPYVPLPDEYVDTALISLVLHELAHPLAYLREAHRILSAGGQLWVIEWQKKETAYGPPVNERMSVEEWTALMKEAGFVEMRADLYEPALVLLTAAKSDSPI